MGELLIRTALCFNIWGDNDKAAQLCIQRICHSVHCFFKDIVPPQSFILFSSLAFFFCFYSYLFLFLRLCQTVENRKYKKDEKNILAVISS